MKKGNKKRRIRYILKVMYENNKARLLRIVSHGLKVATESNNLGLVKKIEMDLKLIKEL